MRLDRPEHGLRWRRQHIGGPNRAAPPPADTGPTKPALVRASPLPTTTARRNAPLESLDAAREVRRAHSCSDGSHRARTAVPTSSSHRPLSATSGHGSSIHSSLNPLPSSLRSGTRAASARWASDGSPPNAASTTFNPVWRQRLRQFQGKRPDPAHRIAGHQDAFEARLTHGLFQPTPTAPAVKGAAPECR